MQKVNTNLKTSQYVFDKIFEVNDNLTNQTIIEDKDIVKVENDIEEEFDFEDIEEKSDFENIEGEFDLENIEEKLKYIKKEFDFSENDEEKIVKYFEEF